MKTYNTDFQ